MYQVPFEWNEPAIVGLNDAHHVMWNLWVPDNDYYNRMLWCQLTRTQRRRVVQRLHSNDSSYGSRKSAPLHVQLKTEWSEWWIQIIQAMGFSESSVRQIAPSDVPLKAEWSETVHCRKHSHTVCVSVYVQNQPLALMCVYIYTCKSHQQRSFHHDLYIYQWWAYHIMVSNDSDLWPYSANVLMA